MKPLPTSKTSSLLIGIILINTLLGTCVQADVIYGTPAKVSNINSEFSDGSVQISRNGLELYMASTRDGGVRRIYVSKRMTTNDAWPVPTQLNAPVNPDVAQDFPSLSADGLELYYADGVLDTPDPGGYGDSDIWVLTRDSITAPWNAPENLGPTVNSGSVENTPCISAGGLELYFTSSVPNHPRNSEILMTTRLSKDDPWGVPITLNESVNSDQYEYTPFISTDGLSLFFSRGYSKSHIHVCTRTSVTDPWGPSQFFTVVNSGSANDIFGANPGSAEYVACLSTEDPTIYFARGSSAFATDYKIWQVDVFPIVDFNSDGVVDTLDAFELLDTWGSPGDSLCDIAPLPFGDGVVDARDLALLADYMIEQTEVTDVNDLLNTQSGR